MALTYETITYTGSERDDVQVNDSVETAYKEATWDFHGETVTERFTIPKDDFTVSGVFDEAAAEAHIDAELSFRIDSYESIKEWVDPRTMTERV